MHANYTYNPTTRVLYRVTKRHNEIKTQEERLGRNKILKNYFRGLQDIFALICQLGGLEIAFCIPSARGIHFLVSPAFVSKVSLDFTRRVKLSAFSSSLACHI